MKITARIAAPLDPGFEPAILCNRAYESRVKAEPNAVRLVIGLERDKGFLSRFETMVESELSDEGLRYVERLVKFLLWARGGHRLYIGGPAVYGKAIAEIYSASGERAF